ncbi:hypothetical protein [Lichenicola sp.]|uniref:hypothetical protein n=1 Tax=Lichenicola sp. TaxID=2804529 RepID=UPI003B006983
MAATAKKTDPKLWEKVKAEVTAGDKGGHPGQWSARKAQLAVAEYKKHGGGYSGGKSTDNHLAQWTREEWDTKSGAKSGDTGERYLPKQARKSLDKTEYDRTTAKKRADTRKGRQYSAQPADVAAKTARHRSGGRTELAALTRQELLERAGERQIKGRSRMKKDALVAALS